MHVYCIHTHYIHIYIYVDVYSITKNNIYNIYKHVCTVIVILLIVITLIALFALRLVIIGSFIILTLMINVTCLYVVFWVDSNLC